MHRRWWWSQWWGDGTGSQLEGAQGAQGPGGLQGRSILIFQRVETRGSGKGGLCRAERQKVVVVEVVGKKDMGWRRHRDGLDVESVRPVSHSVSPPACSQLIRGGQKRAGTTRKPTTCPMVESIDCIETARSYDGGALFYSSVCVLSPSVVAPRLPLWRRRPLGLQEAPPASVVQLQHLLLHLHHFVLPHHLPSSTVPFTIHTTHAIHAIHHSVPSHPGFPRSASLRPPALCALT